MASDDEPRPLAALPKADLHLHLEGAMRYSTLVELCRHHGVPVPRDTRGRRFDGFGEFVATYVAACEVLRDAADLQRLVLEVAEDARASGAVWIEPALSITVYADRFGGVAPTFRILAAAAEAAERMTGVGIGYIIACERHAPMAEAEALAAFVRDEAPEVAINGRRALVGFGLHGSEAGFPPAPFEGVFRTACAGTGIASLPHAGEIAPDPGLGSGAASVRDAMRVLKAKRVGHGVLAHGDEAVLREAAAGCVCFDVCVTSNVLLSVVADAASHPLPALLAHGVPCSLGSDDPLLFGASLLDEYTTCRTALALPDAVLAACARASLEYSCAPTALIEAGVQGVTAWLDGEPAAA